MAPPRRPRAPTRACPRRTTPRHSTGSCDRAVRGFRGPVAGSLEGASRRPPPTGHLGGRRAGRVEAGSQRPRPRGPDGHLEAGREPTGRHSGGRRLRGRRPSPEDRRRTLLHLTSRGRGAVRVIDEAVAVVEAGMAAKIGRDELLDLYRALEKLDDE